MPNFFLSLPLTFKKYEWQLIRRKNILFHLHIFPSLLKVSVIKAEQNINDKEKLIISFVQQYQALVQYTSPDN